MVTLSPSKTVNKWFYVSIVRLLALEPSSFITSLPCVDGKHGNNNSTFVCNNQLISGRCLALIVLLFNFTLRVRVRRVVVKLRSVIVRVIVRRLRIRVTASGIELFFASLGLHLHLQA